MTVGDKMASNGLHNSTFEEPSVRREAKASTPAELKTSPGLGAHSSSRDDSSSSQHAFSHTGSTETLCPERVDGLNSSSVSPLATPVSPLATSGPFLATTRDLKSEMTNAAALLTAKGNVAEGHLHKLGNISSSRSRQQNVAFSDNRSETSSIPSKFKVQ